MTAMRSIKIAILAMGGEGGGVLADWIAALATANGYLAQATSVPGVAQRTGATIYYLELFPQPGAGKRPVLALMPFPGDVDVVIASELMEAGRAVQRGFVTPDRTTLVASSHRVYAIGERSALADGRVDANALRQGMELAAKRLVSFDMAAIAEANGSVISAVLFGALAGADVLPFAQDAFAATIRDSSAAAPANLAAFAAGVEGARGQDARIPPPPAQKSESVAPGEAAALLAEASASFNGPALAFVREGLLRAAHYQDSAYARRYLDLLAPFRAIERERGDGSGVLLIETARQLALAMTYEDTARVAELKIRPARFARIRNEARAGNDQPVEIADFLHPRLQEIADSLPAALARWLLRTDWARSTVERLTTSGRIIRPTTLRGFFLLYAIAALKRWRRRSLRFEREQHDIAQWLGLVERTAAQDYALALELVEARGLVKGYGDTHARGSARFGHLLAALPAVAIRPDAAAIMKKLRSAALADETGAALDKALRQLNPSADGRSRAAERIRPE